MRNRNWFLGIIFVLAAIFVIAGQTNIFWNFGIITIVASALLVAIMVQSIVRLNFFGIFMPLAFLYVIYEQPLNLISISIWQLIVAAVFISIGLTIIFKKRPRKSYYRHEDDRYFTQTSESIDDNNPYTKISFGSSSKYLHTDCLKSGQFFVSFGALEVYFDQAQLSPQGAEIFVDCSFGSISLYVPKSWRVIDKLNVSLGGVENNTHFATRDENAPTLTLTGNVHLGGIEIKYI